MSQKYPGFYLYYDWLDALNNMPPETALGIINNLRNYAQYDTEPPFLPGWEGFVQGFMIAQLKRSKSISQSCRAERRRRTELLQQATTENSDLSELPDDVRRLQEAIRKATSPLHPDDTLYFL